MSRSAYKFELEASLILDDQTVQFNPNYIKYLVIDSNYETIYMPVIYLSLSVNKETYKLLLANENGGKIYLRINRYNEYSQNKLFKKYIEGQFTYLTSNDNPNYAEDLSSSNDEDNMYMLINLALMDMGIVNKEKKSFNGIYKDIDQGTLILRAFQEVDSIICPLKYNPHYDTIMIPPLSSIHKYLYYLFDLCPFYDTNYMFFMDFDKTYLLDYSGNYCISADNQKENVQINIHSVLDDESYYEGMEEDEYGYTMEINPAYTTFTLNKTTDKISNQFVFVDDEGEIQKVDVNVNAAEDSVVKQIFVRKEHAKLYMNAINSSAKELEVMKESLDSSIITPNKAFTINNYKDHNYDGKYTLIYKREIIRNISGSFRNSVSLGLRKVGAIIPLRDDVEARAVYDNASAVYRRKTTAPVRDTSDYILTNSGEYIKKN